MSSRDKTALLAKEQMEGRLERRVNLSEISAAVHRPGKRMRQPGRQARPPAAMDIADIEVIDEYQFVLDSIQQGCSAMFITGKAGTGKSTLIRFLTAKIDKCAVVAPTAISAINVGGSTIHSFFGIPPRTLNPDEVFDPQQHMRPVLQNLDGLIVDEVSMVRPDLVDCMSNCLKKVKNNAQPFGGVPVIFVGDILQLPPVVDQEAQGVYFTHHYHSPYFYSAEVFREVEILPLELKKVFRQQDEHFIAALDRIRCNRNLPDALELLNSRCRQPPKDDEAICLVPANAGAWEINEYKLGRIDAPAQCFNAIYEGSLEAGRVRFPAPDQQRLKVGAKVIFGKNNRPMWWNGSQGEVTAIEADSLRIKLQETGNIVPVSRMCWEKLKYRYDPRTRRIEAQKIGSFTQFPVNLGWAITIHKSQGMTMDAVKIDLGRGAFCTGQTYVALSRCRTLQGIHLAKPLQPRDVQVDQSVVEFYRKIGFFDEDKESYVDAGFFDN